MDTTKDSQNVQDSEEYVSPCYQHFFTYSQELQDLHYLPPPEKPHVIYRKAALSCGACGQYFLSDEYYVKHKCSESLLK